MFGFAMAVARFRERLPAWLLFFATLLLAAKTIAAVIAKVGHAAPTIDDAYIHFQYARAIAEGHPLRYHAGEPISTGATSALWPLLLSPFYAVGFRDVALTWPAWLLSFAALGALAWDAAAIVRPLAGSIAATTTAALVLAFGGHVWCAASGMEVVPFAWCIVHTIRRASEWAEWSMPRTRARLIEMLAFANAAALLRPEGLVFGVAVALVVFVHGAHFDRERPAKFRRLAAVGAVALPALVTVVLRAKSGSALPNTALAKLLYFGPYTQGPALRAAIRENFGIFFGSLLDGEVWSAEFLPSGGAFVAVLGVVAIGIVAWERRKLTRGLLVLLLALAMMIPCFYITFLWNRLRYLWPFATGWLIGLACLAHLLATAARRIGLSGRWLEALVGGAIVGLLLSKMSWVIEDVAQSASGIDRQQVAAGRWAREHLPASARIGINDAGAIAYFGERRTFDIVGLTTTGEAKYWLAGVASRFEHYEKLGVDRLPTHFIVYPEWLGTDVLFGAALAEFTVLDSTILGGRTKRAYVADWSSLSTGELPWTSPDGTISDALDVADLESEKSHGYELGAAHEGEQLVRTGISPRGARVTDGGRTERRRERFVAKLAPRSAHRAIVRLEAIVKAHVVLRAGKSASEADVEPTGDWTEIALPIAADDASAHTEIALEADEPVSVFHYWFVTDAR